jgi:hypothetical protein
MQYIVIPDTLNFLWSAIGKPTGHSKLGQAGRYFKRWATKGWVSVPDLEDLVDLLDKRLASYQFRVRELAETFGLKFESVYSRPKASSNGASGFDAIRVEEAALFLFMLERMGFQVDPSELVELLLPAVKSRKKVLFSDAELELFWYYKTRHKQEGLGIRIEAYNSDHEEKSQVKTAQGYVVRLIADEHGKATGLIFQSPKYRKPGLRMPTTCPLCGYEWYSGDPDSSAAHRKVHKRTMNWLDPQPMPQLAAELQAGTEAAWVTRRSPDWKHQEMYERAVAFKRELRFDFIQWQNPKVDQDQQAVGYLFSDSEGAVIGACCFQHYEEAERSERWGLAWIWICPKERRKGILAAHWQIFKERFGDFNVEFPISDAMQGFLKKQGEGSISS